MTYSTDNDLTPTEGLLLETTEDLLNDPNLSEGLRAELLKFKGLVERGQGSSEEAQNLGARIAFRGIAEGLAFEESTEEADAPAAPEPEDRWNVVLHNDDVTDFGDVVEILHETLLLPVSEAANFTLSVDQVGQHVVHQDAYEVSAHLAAQLQGHGLKVGLEKV